MSLDAGNFQLFYRQRMSSSGRRPCAAWRRLFPARGRRRVQQDFQLAHGVAELDPIAFAISPLGLAKLRALPGLVRTGGAKSRRVDMVGAADQLVLGRLVEDRLPIIGEVGARGLPLSIFRRCSRLSRSPMQGGAKRQGADVRSKREHEIDSVGGFDDPCRRQRHLRFATGTCPGGDRPCHFPS